MSSSSNSQDFEETKLPGFGLPVNALPEGRSCFPNAITSWAASNIAVREQTMLAMINEITEKPEWARKVSDNAIVAKWRKEALGREGVDFSEAMFEYCIAELRDKAAHFVQTGRVIVLDNSAGIVKSDTAIPTHLAEELKTAVRPLEDVPNHHKDWHPGSNEKVLDLVHPSLYPLMYGRSRVIPSGRLSLSDCIARCGEGVVIPKPNQDEIALRGNNRYLPNGSPRADTRWASRASVMDYWSDSYQWLPSEIEFRGDDEVEITSYINNLHPRNKELYGVLEKVIAKTIPSWNDCLSYLNGDSLMRVPTGDGARYEHPSGEQRLPEPDEDEYTRWNRDREWHRANRVLIQPEPRDYVPLSREAITSVDLRKDWKEKGLQVIVKLANIELRPEDGKTYYDGGTWHIEGQLNEHICASAIYYYDQSNITESRLAFRQLTKGQDIEEMEYDQDDYGGLEELFGIEQSGPYLLNLGSVSTKEGRLLVFPNVLQHQVQPFQLADPSKPGYRKILALFLVDPNIRTLSTANIPPQQRDWWAEVVGQDKSTRLGKLPAELMDHVVEMTDEWPISLEEAKKVREDLMHKRSMYVDKVNRDYEQEGFSFCEH
ncbi:hypothetical protein AAF712_003212 [Marasmius tenuissimus]|uniref:Duf1665 domain containing protein n=1 Tax=Marasmius tenuissimus TaxID=585030 RepID=A0ABR3A888_9AGAR|nr:hypothetical protein PM082_012003 [Marasmius tenuissimus]